MAMAPAASLTSLISSSSSSSRHNKLNFPLNNRPNTYLSSSPLKPTTIPHLLCISPPSTSDPSILLQPLDFTQKQLQTLIRTQPELHSSPPHLLRRRISALLSLSLPPSSLLRCPHLLTSPALDPLLDLLPDLRPHKLRRLLSSPNPHLLSDLPSKLQLLINHSVPKEKVAHILNNVNALKVFGEMPVRDLEESLLFLERRFPWPDIILRRPAILNLDLHLQLVPRVEFLTDLANGDEEASTFLIMKLPAILAYSVEHFESHLDFWASAGLSKEQVFKIASVYPNMFSVSRENKLEPRVAFLIQCGLNSEDIYKFLIKAPLFVSLSFRDNLSKKLSFLVKVGYRQRTREMAMAIGAATRTSSENMQAVIGLFFKYGFSCEDVLIMSKKHPQILQYKYESLEKKVEFLIEEMERDVGELMAFPAFLGYKLDDRIKRRYEVKKEVRGKGMSLNKLLSVSAKKFNLKMGWSADC